MRKLYGVALLCAAVAGLAVPRLATAQLGLRGGMNLSKFVGDDAASESSTKLRMGASLSLLRVGPVSLNPEVYYAQRGGRQIAPASEPNPLVQAYDFSMNYLEVPLLVKLSLVKVGPIRPYIAGGPVYAWQLECDVSLIGLTSETEQDCEDDTFTNARTAIKNADTGIMAGAGIDFNVFGIGAITLDARLVRGLDRITEDSSAGGDVKSQAVSLMLGYSIGAGGSGGLGGR